MAKRGNTPSILIADDSPGTLDALSMMLEGQGYDVRTAADGRLALESARSNPPDLVLLDIRMPEMDGYEVCRRLKEDENLRDVPVIFLSALDEPEDKLEGFAAGGVDYIPKPFHAQEVLARAQTHLELRQYQKELEQTNRALQQAIEELKTAEVERDRSEHARRENESRTEAIVEAAVEGIIVIDERGIVSLFNPAASRLFGYAPGEIIGRNVSMLMPPEHAEAHDEYLARFLRTGKRRLIGGRREVDGLRKDGSRIPIELSVNEMPLGEGRFFIGAARDIRDRKRAEEALRLDEERLEALLTLSQKDELSEEELADHALEEAVRLTQSKVGYLHFLGPDETTLQLYTWSAGALKMCTAEKTSHYPLEKAGIWADCVRLRKPAMHNDYQSFPDKKGYPEGHFPVLRHLSVPVFDGDRIVAVAGVGNKEEPYDEADIRQLSLFMNGMWTILERKRVEEELRRGTEELEAFNKAMVGRETRIIGMKEEINRLCGELGREPPYPPVWREPEPRDGLGGSPETAEGSQA